MQKILVIGGRSGIGLQTVELGRQAGRSMFAFSRNTIQGVNNGVQYLRGDVTDSGDVRAAVRGMDAVVLSLGVPLDLRMLTGPISVFSAGTRLVIDAMQNEGVERLVVVTGFGAGDSLAAIHPLQRIGFNWVFGRAYADKNLQEQHVQSSALQWTIVRPGILTNGRCNEAHQVLVAPSVWRNGIVSRASVAHFILQTIQQGTHVHQAPVVIN